MRINFDEGKLSTEEVQQKLKEEFPDYQIIQQNKKIIMVQKSKSIGARVIVYKKRAHVTGSFPTVGAQMLFTLGFLLLGILIPMIVYFAAFQPGQKALEREIGASIQKMVEI